jgi:homocysteine S-methyltransferase
VSFRLMTNGSNLAGDRVFIADGGLETALIFHQGIELPEFAAFVLLDRADGRAALRAYFEPYLRLAEQHGTGLVLDTATWRANPDWGTRLGYDAADLDRVNRAAVVFANELAGDAPDVLVNGVIGPRGDGYDPAELMTADQARHYHAAQAASFAAAGADLATAVTMTHAGEATGVALAARDAGLPVAISFTVETDGRLPDGSPLGAAIEYVDAATDAAPIYYMINCAHPTHFAGVLAEAGAWRERIGGIRANASAKSHAELDAAEELDAGDPADLGRRYRDLRRALPRVTLLGGCCGTDARHIEAVLGAWTA